MRVHEWMTAHPTSIGPDATVAEARRTLRDGGFRHLPVVRCGWLAGMVSDRDVAETSGDQLVRNVMSSPVYTASPDDDVAVVAQSLLAHRINAVPVLTEDGFLLGMITTTDCLLALLDRCSAGPVGTGRTAGD